MDENTKDVVLGVTAVLGTLGGVWLGRWLEARQEGRRRFLEERREVYGRFALIAQEIRRSVESPLFEAGASWPPRWREDLVADLRGATGPMRLIAPAEVRNAAVAYARTAMPLMEGDFRGRQIALVGPQEVRDELLALEQGFIDAARRDLGVPGEVQ